MGAMNLASLDVANAVGAGYGLLSVVWAGFALILIGLRIFGLTLWVQEGRNLSDRSLPPVDRLSPAGAPIIVPSFWDEGRPSPKSSPSGEKGLTGAWHDMPALCRLPQLQEPAGISEMRLISKGVYNA